MTQAKSDVDLVARDYQIPIEAVHAALQYYEKHKEIIDSKLIVNAEKLGARGCLLCIVLNMHRVYGARGI